MASSKYPSIISGIVGANGAFRVVVTQPWLVHRHLAAGERVFVVPKVRVREPVCGHGITDVIRLVESHVHQTLIDEAKQ